MKKRNWISLLLIIVCLGVLFGYRAVIRIQTDSSSPEITAQEQLLEVSVQEPRTALLAGITARDNRDGDVTDSLVVESIRLLRPDGTVEVTYAAFDQSGNVSKLTREARYNDYESPKFDLTAPLMFEQNAGADVLSLITAQDMMDGDITHRIRVTALEPVNSGFTGTYNTKFQMTNSLGDTVELVLPVEIYTPGPNEGRLILTNYLIYLKVGDSFNSRSFLDRISIGREDIDLSRELPENVKLLVSGKVQTGEPGVYQIDYHVDYYPNPARTDMVYSAYSRLIVIVEG